MIVVDVPLGRAPVRRVRLGEALKRMGWDQVDLAERLGVDHSTVSRWVAGKSIPRLNRALRIAMLLGVSVEALWPDLDVEGVRRERKRRGVGRSHGSAQAADGGSALG